MIWNIEIKTPHAVDPALEILKQFRSTHQLIVTSFFHDILPQVSKVLNIECGALVAHRPVNTSFFLRQLNLFDKSINTIVFPVEFICRDIVSIAHEEGFKVFSYDIENLNDYRKCCKFNVDAIITNHPDLYSSKMNLQDRSG
ncbi:MAG: glycerophosphodiester phosphodiesterase [Candidatus Electrothrix sp. AUS1_2]|nr:glycerophosphodiester phosphodiesterase [Candidatus Electrothrix sp. AUS1_2]